MIFKAGIFYIISMSEIGCISVRHAMFDKQMLNSIAVKQKALARFNAPALGTCYR